MHRTKACAVCLCSRLSSLYSTDYCCSNVQRDVCDCCVHQHVLSKLYSCLTSDVPCPERDCRVYFSPSIVCDVLLNYRSEHLLEDYLREQQWQGKSEEWIERFAKHCPTCQVPIEKNGGCDEMVCIRCRRHFYWSRTKQGDSTPSSSFSLTLFLLVLFILTFSTLIVFK